MFGAQIFWLLGWMQRIRHQYNTGNIEWIVNIGNSHRAHAPAHRSSTYHQ
jgi:hypothetical protein